MSNRTSRGPVSRIGSTFFEPLEERTLMSTYVVTTGADGPGTVKQVLPGLYLASTLRGAVTAANADSKVDTIFINPFFSGKISLTGGELLIGSSVTIQGFGANRQAVDAGGLSRVFNVATGATATINDLTISGGTSNGAGGGDVRNTGALTLTDDTITGGNTVGADGAGVFNNGTLTLLDCTVGNNTSDSSGGGLFNADAGNATVTNSTFYGNQAQFGGAISNTPTGVMLISDSTISGNHADMAGGGISGTVANANDPSFTVLNNTIVAGNTFATPGTIPQGQTQGPDMYGQFTLVSARNLIGAIGNAAGMDPSKNLLGAIAYATPVINAKLAPLGFYGGTTQTMPPLPGSPAIDAGSNALIPSGVKTDERGFARVTHGTVDIGAVETRFSGVFAEPALPAGLPATNLILDALASLGWL
jgi:fibronectin-binding autotransporter adhesin